MNLVQILISYYIGVGSLIFSECILYADRNHWIFLKSLCIMWNIWKINHIWFYTNYFLFNLDSSGGQVIKAYDRDWMVMVLNPNLALF